MRALLLGLIVAVTNCGSPARPPAAATPTPARAGATPPDCGPHAAAVCNSSSCSGCPCGSWACVSTEPTCSTDGDCAAGEHCYCRGVGEDPCHPGMTTAACEEARCGGRVCGASPPLAPP